MPPDAVYVGRPSVWGNQHREGDIYALVDEMDRSIEATGDFWVWLRGRPLAGQADLVAAFRQDVSLCTSDEIADWVAPLQGKTLVCWCPLDKPCHADVLAELVH